MYFLLVELFAVASSLWAFERYATVIGALIILYLIVARSLEKITLTSLHNRPVLITGCRAGFGYDLAMRCLQMGMPVFAAFHSNRGRKEFEEAASKIAHSDWLLHTLVLDVASDDSIQKARKFVEERLHKYGGRLWALVNNAGIVGVGWDEYSTPNDYEYLMDINTLGVIRVTHAFKDLIKQSRGRIIIMTSVMGKVALPLFGTYSVAKFATTGYTDVLSVEMSRFGVEVVGIEAGFFVTPMADIDAAIARVETIWRGLSEVRRAEYPEEHMRWTQDLIDSVRKLEDQDVSKVTEVYMSALTSVFPRRRWQVGRDAVFIFGPLSLLPSRWIHFLLRFYCRYWMREPAPRQVLRQAPISISNLPVLTPNVEKVDLNNNTNQNSNNHVNDVSNKNINSKLTTFNGIINKT